MEISVPDLCGACVEDKEVACPRDTDMQCLHCGARLCARHGLMHMKNVHAISIDWRGFLKNDVEPNYPTPKEIKKELSRLRKRDGWE